MTSMATALSAIMYPLSNQVALKDLYPPTTGSKKKRIRPFRPILMNIFLTNLEHT